MRIAVIGSGVAGGVETRPAEMSHVRPVRRLRPGVRQRARAAGAPPVGPGTGVPHDGMVFCYVNGHVLAVDGGWLAR